MTYLNNKIKSFELTLFAKMLVETNLIEKAPGADILKEIIRF
jgi:hypothetical protein